MNDPEKKPETATVTTAPVVEEAGMSITPIESKELPMGTIGRAIPLKYPFKGGDKTFTEVSFSRRPKARDLIEADAIPGSDAERELHLFAKLLGVIPGDLTEMDAVDYLKVQKEYLAFLA